MPRPSACAPFPVLVAQYAEPHRRYHDARHIKACLAALDEVREFVTDPVALELALWFHDAVYNPRASDNEARSARLGAGMIECSGGSADLVRQVETMVLAIRLHHPCGESDIPWMVDIDLSILGAAPDVFDAYDAGIRAEYAWVEPAVFREKRALVLEGFIERPALFSTAYFRTRLEASARRNLERARRSV